MTRSAWPPPYVVPANEPDAVRNLWVYALDPSISRRNGSIARVQIPRELCEAGPKSQLFEVDCRDRDGGVRYAGHDFGKDDDRCGEAGEREPDPADPGFHARMVYGVALLTYESFRKALGRYPTWAFSGGEPHIAAPLVLRPFAMNELNAHYATTERAVSFGFRRAAPATSRSEMTEGSKIRPEAQAAPSHARQGTDRRQSVFTSLSSDIIAHEVTHALFDGMRPYFAEPTHPDVEALHEALADLVALFQRLTYTELVTAQLDKLGGRLTDATLLSVIAPLIGDAVGVSGAKPGLRTFEFALEAAERSADGRVTEPPVTLDSIASDAAPHERGRVLAEAVFDAFQTVLNHKLDPLFELATDGSGVLREGRVPAPLLARLVRMTTRTAEHFLTICVRAIDYCPPVHIDFGDYLRALITADRRLIRHDPHGYREAIISAFALRRIRPKHVSILSESALLWRPPCPDIPSLEDLALGRQRFVSDPSIPLDAKEVERQACVFGEALTLRPELRAALGLHRPDETYSLPEIVTVRPSRRIGPDNQMSFDLIIEVVQTRRQVIEGRPVPFRGGSTVVLGSDGKIRYIVRKRIDQAERLSAWRAFLSGAHNVERLERLLDAGNAGFKRRCFQDPCPSPLAE